eukprot:scaffold7558_cov277-Pinguiococcus_pyrenoidosus.AAC.4
MSQSDQWFKRCGRQKPSRKSGNNGTPDRPSTQGGADACADGPRAGREALRRVQRRVRDLIDRPDDIERSHALYRRFLCFPACAVHPIRRVVPHETENSIPVVVLHLADASDALWLWGAGDATSSLRGRAHVQSSLAPPSSRRTRLLDPVDGHLLPGAMLAIRAVKVLRDVSQAHESVPVVLGRVPVLDVCRTYGDRRCSPSVAADAARAHAHRPCVAGSRDWFGRSKFCGYERSGIASEIRRS